MSIKLEKSTRIDEYLNKLNPRYYPLYAFVLTAVVYTFALSVAGVLGNGVYVLETGDMKAQHIPFIMQMGEVLKGKHSLWYSWNIGLGQSSIGSYAYYTLSPFNVLYWILGNDRIHIASALVVVLKAATSALTFQFFISYYLRHEYFETVLFSMMYALNGFVVCYFHTIVFMDAVLIFPLIMLGALRLMRENKKGLLIFAYFYLISVQLYMGYIIGISSFIVILIYYLYKRVYINRKNRYRFITGYILSVLFAVGLSAVIWLPAGLNILELANSIKIYQTKPWCNPIMLLNNVFVGMYQSIDGFIPYYYCGLLAVVAVPHFFGNKKISKRKRFYYFISIIAFCVIITISPLNLAMHGFDEPNCLGFRYSFVLSFLLLSILANEFPYLVQKNALKKGYIILLTIISLSVLLLNKYIFFKDTDIIYEALGEDFDSNKLWLIILNLSFVLLIYSLINSYRSKRLDILTVRALLTVLLIVECTANIVCIQKKYEDRDTVLVDDFYVKAQENTSNKIFLDSKDDLYVRTIYQDSYILNTALQHDISSLAIFTSLISDRLKDMLVSLGYEYKSNCITGAGWTSVTATLFGIDYIIDGANIVSEDPSLPVLLEENDLYYQNIIKNKNVLPIMFVSDKAILDYSKGENAFDSHEKLFSALLGRKQTFYKKIDMYTTSDNATLVYQDGETIIHNNNYPDGEAIVQYRTKEKVSKRIFANIYNKLAVYRDSVYKVGAQMEPLYGDEIYKTNVPKVYPNQTFMLGASQDGINGFDMTVPKEIENLRYETACFVEFDEVKFDKIFDELSSHGIQITSFEDGYVEGNIDCYDKDCILFTTIPYEKGWKAYVDGEEVSVIPIVEDALCGLELAEGKHNIIFKYVPPGKTAGLLITFVTLIWMLIVSIYKKVNEGRVYKA